MPRNIGTGIYVIPPDTEGIPDQTIESVPYNAYIHDVETDLNNPRPIIAGGTGANDADEALVNLGAEKATQLVTNYDTNVWVPGSFRSAGSATAGPVDGHAFAGIVYLNEPYIDPPTNANVVVSARDMDDTAVPKRVYVREKKANLWGSWTVIDASTLPFPPTGDLSATTILAAIQELEAEKASLAFVAATYAPINSPLFTGDARAPTPTTTDNDTSIATTAYVNAYVTAFATGANAATFDAIAYTGMQINGSMEVSQENGSSVVSASAANKYVLDGWSVQSFGAQVMSCQRSDSGTFPMPPGFICALSATATTPNAAPATGDRCLITQCMEMSRVSRLCWGTNSALPMTIAFWVYTNRPGTYSGSVCNSALTRSYVFSFNIAASGVWEYKTIVIPGDITGTWFDFPNRENPGLYVIVAMMAGSTFLTAPNTWTAGTFFGATGTGNGVAITSSLFAVTGFIALPGANFLPVPGKSWLVMRPYSQELEASMRYYQKHQVMVETAALFQSWSLPVPMRNAPAITGGGAGFTVQAASMTAVNVSQTTRGLQTLVFDARL